MISYYSIQIESYATRIKFITYNYLSNASFDHETDMSLIKSHPVVCLKTIIFQLLYVIIIRPRRGREAMM